MKTVTENQVINYTQLFIGGEWLEPVSTEIIKLK